MDAPKKYDVPVIWNNVIVGVDAVNLLAHIIREGGL